MRRTNCVNCGGTIDAKTSQCPFCGTWYIDMNPADLNGGQVVFKFQGQIMRGYITLFRRKDINYEQRRDKEGRIQSPKRKSLIEFSIIAGDLDLLNEEPQEWSNVCDSW